MGPLAGKRIIELKGIGPGPYAGMLLADLGAEVIVVERASRPNPNGIPAQFDTMSRGKRSIALDLKSQTGVDALLQLVESADAIFEGFRPGVAEKLGVGPESCLERNPRIVYGRITGWGQNGTVAHSAGHDLNYISLTGVAAAIGTQQQPVPPLNIIGDFAAGSLFLVVGILAALVNVQKTGKGEVVDAAITDGSAHLMSLFHTLDAMKRWVPQRESNLLDGGCPYYGIYRTADDRFISVAAIEPHFFATLLELAGLPQEYAERQSDPRAWPEMRRTFEARFLEKTRDEWAAIFEGSDACASAVLDYTEAPLHPHNQARGTYIDIGGVTQPAPAPRFSQSVCGQPKAPVKEGANTRDVLRDWGFSDSQIESLGMSGVLT